MMISTKKKLAALSLISSAVVAANAFAGTENIKIVGTLDGYVPLGNPNSLTAVENIAGKHITFQKIELSPAAKQWLAKHADDTTVRPQMLTADAALPTQVQLGMNDVPVLDQGRHGSCVTFASSGALDAARGKEDYISQLCNLELGAYLESQDEKHYSGWDGSWGDVVLNQIKDYGIINMTSQRQEGCAGVYEYPRDTASNKGKPMPADEFTARSEKIMDTISFKTLSTHADAFSDSANAAPNTLLKIKQALNNGHRVTFGTLLDTKLGHNGAVGTYKVKNDTWMVTPEVIKDAKEGTIEAGHEMIITGYDDNAVAVGPNGAKQIGVLTLRNSWGSFAGDNGNYYLTYAHFRLLADESYEIIPASGNASHKAK